MSKVAFRSKQLDFHKPVPIYWSEELAELSDPSVVTRAIPYIPSGMEKEEESEQHLQWALSTQEKLGTTADSVIPIPEVDLLTKEEYEEFYSREFKITKHLIRIQTFGAETEFPDYDLDTEDEKWLAENGSRFELSPLQFESMIDRLEKGCGQQVVQLAEAKALLKEDDDLTTLVYNYWLAKRLRLHHPLLLHVKTDKRDGVSVNDPYVAFRRRAEKMQTRKNRKSDELSYERMVKLKRDCGKLVTLLELIRRREKSKKELIQLAREIFGKRYELNDFDGRVAMEAEAERLKDRRPAYMTPKFLHQQQLRPENASSAANNNNNNNSTSGAHKEELRNQKRHLANVENARQHKRQRMRENGFIPASAIPDDMQLSHLRQISKAETASSTAPPAVPVIEVPPSEPIQQPPQPKQQLPPVPDGRFAFRRMAGAVYLAPHPFRTRLQPPVGVVNDPAVLSPLHLSKHGRQGRFCLTSIHTDSALPAALATENAAGLAAEDNQNNHLLAVPSSACIGYARLRRGRGGASRVIIDRAPPNRWSESLNHITDWQSESPLAGRLAQIYKDYIQSNNITHYSQRSITPPVRSSSSSLICAASSVALLRPPNLEINTGPSNSVSHSASASHSPCATLRPNTPSVVPPPRPPSIPSTSTQVVPANSSTQQQQSRLIFPTPMVTFLPNAATSSNSPVINVNNSSLRQPPQQQLPAPPPQPLPIILETS